MFDKFQAYALSLWYWISVIAVCVSLECVALFYQYVLNEPPCVLCIQARFWVFVGIIAAIFGAVLHKRPMTRVAVQLTIIGALIGLLSRSWTSVLVERGLYEGQCGMDAGFPAWFALDAWFPQVFEVWAMCGYTPFFIFGLTMGEGLVYGAAILLLIALAVIGIQIKALFSNNK